MLDFRRPNRLLEAASVLLSLVVAACSFEPPKEEVPGTGGAGGNSASSASSSTSSSTSSTTSSTSASSSGSSGEFCTNGLDDDNNDAIDCADPACQTLYACVNNDLPPEPGWSDPFYASYVTFNAPEAPCTDGSAPKSYGIGPSPDACAPCKCALPDARCAGAVLTCFGSQDCSSSMITADIAVPGCTVVSGIYSCMVTQPTMLDVGNGQCNVTSGGTLLVPNAFAQKLLRCDAPSNAGAGCGTGQHCALQPAPEYTWSCIATTGAKTCPAAWPTPLTGYASWQDSRGCTACSCLPDKAICFEGSEFSAHVLGTCSDTGNNVSFGGCSPTGAAGGIKYVEPTPYMPPEGCSTSTTGKLDAQELTTICCRP